MPASGLSPSIPNIVDTPAELASYDGLLIPDKTIVKVTSSLTTGPNQATRTYRFKAGSVAVDTNAGILVIAPGTNPAGGKWLCVDPVVNVQVAAAIFNFNLANGATVWTVPTGFRLLWLRSMIEISVAWTGGAASAIGLSSSNAAYNTAGDLMGAAAGDVAANLAAGFQGTIGTKVAAQYATRPPVVLVAGDNVLFNRIVSAFTAGSGNLHMQFVQLP